MAHARDGVKNTVVAVASRERSAPRQQPGAGYPAPTKAQVEMGFSRTALRSGAQVGEELGADLVGQYGFGPVLGVVEGQGEWGPPRGWRPFRLRLGSGEPC